MDNVNIAVQLCIDQHGSCHTVTFHEIRSSGIPLFDSCRIRMQLLLLLQKCPEHIGIFAMNTQKQLWIDLMQLFDDVVQIRLIQIHGLFLGDSIKSMCNILLVKEELERSDSQFGDIILQFRHVLLGTQSQRDSEVHQRVFLADSNFLGHRIKIVALSSVVFHNGSKSTDNFSGRTVLVGFFETVIQSQMLMWINSSRHHIQTGGINHFTILFRCFSRLIDSGNLLIFDINIRFLHIRLKYHRTVFDQHFLTHMNASYPSFLPSLGNRNILLHHHSE